jgi:hypothetical protein
MRSGQPRPVSDHRLARYFVWFAAVLAWFAFGAPQENQRRQRRFGTVTCATLRDAARNLILIRAAQLHRGPKPQPWRNFATAGFRRQNNRCALRGIGGAWLRRRLHARGGLIAQAKHLIGIFRQFRALAAELAARRRRGFTRLRPLIIVAPPEERVADLCAAAPQAADSS